MEGMEGISGRRIALIGGAGFIGHHLALHLHELGAEVSIVDGLDVNNLRSYTALPPETENRDLYMKMINQRLERLTEAGIPLHVVDAREYEALKRTLSQIGPQVVVHMAAVAHAGKSNEDPQGAFGHSLQTLEHSLDYSRTGVEHFLFFSSSMVYGNFETPEVSEDHPKEPIGIYGAQKLAGERFVIAYQQVFDLPYTIIRPSALYGPRCVSRRVGQVFIERALVGGTLQVAGKGDERLDFSYVEDVVNGVSLAIARPEGRNEAFNITAGKSRSIQELVEIVQEHFPEVKVEHVERDKLQPFRGTLKIDKAKELLGYEPKVSLEEGLRRYVAWYRDLTSEGVVAGKDAS
jgi:nucleoside-diphosphate-sugar epimerase